MGIFKYALVVAMFLYAYSKSHDVCIHLGIFIDFITEFSSQSVVRLIALKEQGRSIYGTRTGRGDHHIAGPWSCEGFPLIGKGLSTNFNIASERKIIAKPNLIVLPYTGSISCGQYLDRTLGKFPPIYGPHLLIRSQNCFSRGR